MATDDVTFIFADWMAVRTSFIAIWATGNLRTSQAVPEWVARARIRQALSWRTSTEMGIWTCLWPQWTAAYESSKMTATLTFGRSRTGLACARRTLERRWLWQTSMATGRSTCMWRIIALQRFARNRAQNSPSR